MWMFTNQDRSEKGKLALMQGFPPLPHNISEQKYLF